MIVLQLLLLIVNHKISARSSTEAYLSQVISILDSNKKEELTLLSSVKADYRILAQAVAYYIDIDPNLLDDPNEMKKLASLLAIDEIHVINETGTIIAGTNPQYYGYNFDSGEQISYFKPMLTDKSLTLCQDLTPNTADGRLMMYAATWNEEGSFIVQIGVEPTRLIDLFESNEIENVAKDMAFTEDTILFIADRKTGYIKGTSDLEYLTLNLQDLTDINIFSYEELTSLSNVSLQNKFSNYYCSITSYEDYIVAIYMSHSTYTDSTLASLLIVTVYLVLASIIILFIVRRLFETREQSMEHLQIFASMSEIYYSLHLIDLDKNVAVEYTAKNQVKENFESGNTKQADKTMEKIMHATMSDDYLERGIHFSDITTLKERMKNKKTISAELLGRNVGWIRMVFITITEKDGIPSKVICATQIIDEEKKMTESLYQKSYTDELTKCFNRRAYDNDILTYLDHSEYTDFAYVSLDLNGLKTVNDTLGHEAGAELIRGGVECMNESFGSHGKIYRIGGDEFVALLFVDGDLMKLLTDDFDRKINNWHGELVKNLSISYGYVLSSEARGKSMAEIANLADKRMYESKSNYYKMNGLERRKT